MSVRVVNHRVSARGALIGVALAHGVIPLLLLGPHWWFGIDETVYLSQLNAHVPAGLFSAPRARGTTLIVAPVTLLTSSVAAVRVWLAVLSALGLYLAYRPWVGLVRPAVAVWGAGLFCTLWMVVYYAFEAMPNEWVAFGVLAAAGHMLRYVAGGGRRRLAAAAVACALTALTRPSDALYAVVGLVIVCFVARGGARRRAAAAATVVGGFAAGALEWVIEAWTSYGGLAERVRAAQGENGGGGPHFAGAAQARSLAGPLLCRDGCRAHASYAFAAWWVALAVLVLLGVRVARGRLSAERAAALVGVACAAQYVFAVTYAAPRFLISAYALLSVPAAAGALWLGRAARGRRAQRLARGALLACLAAHVVAQTLIITMNVLPRARRSATATLDAAHQLTRAGVAAPCLVIGRPQDNQKLAYALGCTNTPDDAAGARQALDRGVRVVYLGEPHPAGARRVDLPLGFVGLRTVYVGLPR